MVGRQTPVALNLYGRKTLTSQTIPIVGGIAIERAVLYLVIELNAVSLSVLNATCLRFAISVVAVEFFIIRAAVRDSRRQSNQIAKTEDGTRPRNRFPIVFVGLMMFCLGLGLRQTQNEISATGELAILVGISVNLGFTYAAIASFSMKQESTKAPSM